MTSSQRRSSVSATPRITTHEPTPLVSRIAVPTLVIHAIDDPFVRLLPSTVEKLRANPNITLKLTQHGGHCGFLGTANGADDGRWAETQIAAFFKKFQPTN